MGLNFNMLEKDSLAPLQFTFNAMGCYIVLFGFHLDQYYQVGEYGGWWCVCVATRLQGDLRKSVGIFQTIVQCCFQIKYKSIVGSM